MDRSSIEASKFELKKKFNFFLLSRLHLISGEYQKNGGVKIEAEFFFT